MPIYEYFCPRNNTIYQFYAKTLVQGRTIPKCPDNPVFPLVKMLSPFAVTKRGKGAGENDGPASPGSAVANAGEDPRLEAAMTAMESEFSNVDENDPRAMGRMMRRMAELTGEKIDGDMEEVVRKLEEGADPDSLEEQFGSAEPDADEPGDGAPGEANPVREARHRFRARRLPPTRDPKLYDYE